VQLSSIRTRVRALTNIRSAGLLSDAEIDEYVNEFNRAICEQYSWPQMRGRLTLVATGEATITLSADVRNIIALSTKTTSRLIPARSVGTQEADAFFANITGNPTKYYENAHTRTVTMFPAPEVGTTLVIDYQKNPPSIVNGTDAPPFDSEYHLAWALAAASQILMDRGGDRQKAAEVGHRVSEIVSRMRRRYLMGRDREALPLNARW
jgi:hypothetical protein